MICPYCQTENRDDRATCYSCEKDLSMLRLIVNKAKAHFNAALEHAERGRNEEAINELNNALDLDNNLVNAHVVLGTLYAKTDRLDQAEEQWKAALELDPRMLKAHQYLDKLEDGRRNLPVVRRLRSELILMTLLALVLLVAVIRIAQPDPGRRMLANAQKAYASGNYSASLQILNDLSGIDPQSPYIGQLGVFREIILSEQKLLLEGADLAMQGGDIAAARNALKMLIGRNPGENIRRKAMEMLALADVEEEKALLADARSAVGKGDFLKARDLLQQMEAFERDPAPASLEEAAIIKAEAAQVAREFARRTLSAYQNNAANAEQVQAAIEKARLMLPDAAGSEASEAHIAFLGEIESQARQITRIKAKTEILERHKGGQIDDSQLLEALIALQQQYPDDPSIPELIETFVNPIRQSASNAFKQFLDAEQFDQAQAALNTLKRLQKILGSADAPSAAMQEMLDQKRAAFQIAQLREAYDNENFSQVLEIGEQIESVPDETTRAVIESLIQKANAQLARERFEWMLVRDYQYQTATMSVQIAEKTVREFEQVFEHLPTAIYPTSHDNLLFYLAQSYRRLGLKDQAISALNHLFKEYPDTNVKSEAEAALKSLTTAD